MFVGQAVFFAGLASKLATCSTLSISLVRPPTVAGQEHRLALHQKRTRKRRRRTRCLHCAAVALAVSGRSTADDLDDKDATPNGRPTTAVDGEVVVLRDWLSRQEGRVEIISSSLEEQRGGPNPSSPPHRFQELIQVRTAGQMLAYT